MQIFQDTLAYRMGVLDRANANKMSPVDSAEKAAEKAKRQIPRSLPVLHDAADVCLAVAAGNEAAALAAIATATVGLLEIAARYDLPLEHAVSGVIVNKLGNDPETMGKLLAAYRAGSLRKVATPFDALKLALDKCLKPDAAPADIASVANIELAK